MKLVLRTRYIYWVPSATIALAVLFIPLYLIIRTLGSGDEVWEILIRTRTLGVLFRTLALIGTVVAFSILLAVPMAWITVRTDLPMRRLISVLAVLPLVIPSYVGGFLIVVALGPKGMLQNFLQDLFAIESLPNIYGFPGAALALTLLSYPYILLTVRASLRGIDPALEEGSRGLGYGSWSTFRNITLNQLSPAIGAGSLLVALYTLSDFGAVSILQYETFTWAIFIQYQTAFNRSIAAALSLILVLVAVLILTVEAVTRRSSQLYQSSARGMRTPNLIPLNKWKWPAFGYSCFIVSLSLFLPIFVLGFWVVRGISAGESLELVWTHVFNSISISALAAGLTVIAALPVSFLAVRHSGWLTRFIERSTYLGFALPGIVVALAIIYFGVNYVPFLYQTFALLLVAYVILFLPTASGAVKASLLQVNSKVEDAARSLGSKPINVFLTITLPLLKPGIITGGALVFLVTLKELPATLLLSPIGFQTLATSIWSATTEAFFAKAAASSLLLILVASIPMAWILLRDREGIR
ncbi:MAG: iron ABC transporter permease [SAR202 cluster bacterium Io17-Chloro-G3]|nr:MAG: iron ABC transporter permease [SAR202 cluster bacterium Io17-Chloro-G3]